jgi:hypothetical protein
MSVYYPDDMGEVTTASTAPSAEAILATVRDYLDNAGFPDDTEVRYAQGCNDVLNDLRRILSGGDDDA